MKGLLLGGFVGTVLAVAICAVVPITNGSLASLIGFVGGFSGAQIGLWLDGGL